MTYEEISEHFGIGLDGARMKAKRRKWRLVRNHPQDPVRAEVPTAFLAPRTVPNTQPNASANVRGGTAPSGAEHSLQTLFEDQRRQHAEELARIQSLHFDLVNRLQAQAAAERSLMLERIDAAEIRAEAAEARATAVEDKLHQVLDALLERRRRPWWQGWLSAA
jgi:hypothetical protein